MDYLKEHEETYNTYDELYSAVKELQPVLNPNFSTKKVNPTSQQAFNSKVCLAYPEGGDDCQVSGHKQVNDQLRSQIGSLQNRITNNQKNFEGDMQNKLWVDANNRV